MIRGIGRYAHVTFWIWNAGYELVGLLLWVSTKSADKVNYRLHAPIKITHIENGKALAQDEPRRRYWTSWQGWRWPRYYCSDPDEPVMSGSDDEFSNLEQENVDGKLLAYAIHTCITYHTCVDAECIVERKRKHRPDNVIESSGRSQYMGMGSTSVWHNIHSDDEVLPFQIAICGTEEIEIDPTSTPHRTPIAMDPPTSNPPAYTHSYAHIHLNTPSTHP